MRNISSLKDTQQNTLFDMESCGWWHTGLSREAYRRLENGIEGVFRRSVLELMPAEAVGAAFDPSIGRPSKELHAACGLLLLAEYRNWTVDQSADAWCFDASVQYALRLPRDRQHMCPRTVDSYRALLRENDLAQSVFETVTAAIVKEMGLSIKKQRLDSTHLFSDMARFGRLKLLAVCIKRFLVQLKRHDPERYQALPGELTARYEAGENRLFGAGSKQSRSYQEDLQQAARDMAELIGCFSENDEVSARSSFKSLVRVFTEHCEVTEEEIAVVLPKAEDENAQSARVLQNPSDPDAGYDGHKGPGFQVQLAQAYDTKEPGPGIITACIPQSAAESDSAALEVVAQQQQRMGTTPQALLADTSYGSLANVEQCAANGTLLLAPTPGNARKNLPATTETKVSPRTAAQRSIDIRRHIETTASWKREYSKRSGVEGLHAALDRITGIKQLRVRGMKAVTLSVCFKVTGWNIRAAAQIARNRRKKAENPPKWAKQPLFNASIARFGRVMPEIRHLPRIHSRHPLARIESQRRPLPSPHHSIHFLRRHLGNQALILWTCSIGLVGNLILLHTGKRIWRIIQCVGVARAFSMGCIRCNYLEPS